MNPLIDKTKLLKQYIHEYYKGTPKVSDVEYDLLLRELEELEKAHPEWVVNNSPTSTIIETDNNTKKHYNKMYSIYSEMDTSIEGLKKFTTSINNTELIAEYKFDGQAINLVYQKGKFISAVTRGNKEYGVDKTPIFLASDIVDKQIDNDSDVLEISGEVFISLESFKLINSLSEINTTKDKSIPDKYSNPRSAAIGLLSGKYPQYINHLIFVAYKINYNSSIPEYTTQAEALDYLSRLGFNKKIVNKYFISKDLNVLYEYYLSVTKDREDNKIEFDIDGVVFKVNSLSIQNTLGFNAKYPKWAIAQKFVSKRVLTNIINIETGVGRTGKVLFVCTVDPCKLNGATITRTGPYNHKEIIEKKIAIGSTVIIKLAGEVIPRIDKVLESDNSLEEFTIPKECPFCHSQLVLVKNSLYCPSGLSCSEQLVNSLIHFCSRGGMNIHGLGESYIRRLVLSEVLKTYSDIFSLTEKDLVSLKDDYDPVENNALLNYRYANKIISNIQARRVVEYNKFLCALGIPGLGNSACLKYVGKTIEEILDMSKDEHVKRLGINTGELAYTYFTTPENNKEINKLLNEHLNIVYTF